MEHLIQSTNPSMTMVDEIIKRVDSFFNQMAEDIFNLNQGNSGSFNSAFSSGRIIWADLKYPTFKVNSELYTLIEELTKKLRNYTTSKVELFRLSGNEQVEAYESIIKYYEYLRQASDEIGIGIVVKVRKKND
jgi:hypothetical protein